ncbi:hypothetical protein [Phyllobacterium chamaecytisi]|uniref:hypothetical protein n=1 Tax=Phyllobacterium chamaecytisi TaxID=2876082 RepID=UPI001CCB709C|nr:hypothetical protein [Phyllobacterium sp. KW56]MBZ9600503.1 hypothetical protein [Phyllobacterium sp. KW56]
MAKLNIDLTAFEIRKLLNHRKREEAIELALKALAAGEAKPETQRLVAGLFDAKRGGQPVGLYMWYEIAMENIRLEDEGMSKRKHRVEELARFCGRSGKHVEACLTYYDKGKDESDAI